jgi:nitric oxide reductase subunit B
MEYRKLWIALAIVIIGSFAVLGIAGKQMIDGAPPIPSEVVTTSGQVLFDGKTIQDGQGVWQSIGGQEVGSIWGHGAYVAPDWSADWLHREAVFILDTWARETGAKDYSSLALEQQAAIRARLQQVMRTNTHDPNTGRNHPPCPRRRV